MHCVYNGYTFLVDLYRHCGNLMWQHSHYACYAEERRWLGLPYKPLRHENGAIRTENFFQAGD